MLLAGVVQLLDMGKLPADFWDWTMGADFDFGARQRRREARRAARQAAEQAAAASDTEEGDAEEPGGGVALCIPLSRGVR